MPAFVPVTVSAEATGRWDTVVGSWKLTDRTSLLAHFGLDIGDDGLMYGMGLGYDLTKTVALRGEYVLRADIDSLQFNLVLRVTIQHKIIQKVLDRFFRYFLSRRRY